MSRTYRRAQVEIDCNCGAEYCRRPYWDRDTNWYIRHALVPPKACSCGMKYDYYSKRNYHRDRKPWNKSPKFWKQICERNRRAQVRTFMVHEKYDIIPIFRRENDWTWT